MYGTVMVGTLRGSREEAEKALAGWLEERAPYVEGYVDAGLLFGDDGTTVVNWVQFASREAYVKLADDPAQDEWWQKVFSPLLDGEPRWIDGDWSALPEQRKPSD